MRQIEKLINFRGKEEKLIFNIWNNAESGKTRFYFKFGEYSISTWNGDIRLSDLMFCIAVINPIYPGNPYQATVVKSMKELKLILINSLLNEK